MQAKPIEVSLPFPGSEEITVTISAPRTTTGAGYILALSRRVNELLSLCAQGIPTDDAELKFVRPEVEREPEKPGSIYARDITSSMIRDFEWHPGETIPHLGDLLVTFQSDRQYRYGDVERSRVEAWVEAESKGEYFNKWIKGRYPYKLEAGHA
jgi:hypothetical protein